jgi:hypothetical protein
VGSSRIAIVAAAGLLWSCALFTDLSGLGGEPTPTAEDGSSTPQAAADGQDATVDGGSRDAAANVTPDDAADAAPDQTSPPATCTLARVGEMCRNHSECCSNNCYQGVCEGNGIGARCITDSKCTSDNCYQGFCEGNDVGAHCITDSKCTSGNCYSGFCEGNGKGARCVGDSKCTSKRCISGYCQ